MTTTTPIYGPLMMTPADFARLHGISETTVRECINGESQTP